MLKEALDKYYYIMTVNEQDVYKRQQLTKIK